MDRQHKSQTPTLRLLRRLRIQILDRVGVFRPFSGSALTAKIRELRDLVREHLVDSFGLEQLEARSRGFAIV